MSHLDRKDYGIRIVILICGVIGVAIFVMRGEAGGLLPLALGGAAGALGVSLFQRSDPEGN